MAAPYSYRVIHITDRIHKLIGSSDTRICEYCLHHKFRGKHIYNGKASTECKVQDCGCIM